MPFFRCSGATMAQLASKMLIEEFQSYIGDSFSLSHPLTVQTHYNAFGHSGGTDTVGHFQLKGSFSSLITFFHSYYYNVSTDTNTHGIQSHYRNPDNEKEYLGSTSGTSDITIFTATYNTNANIPKFKKRAVEQLRHLIGDNFSIAYGISVETQNPEPHPYTRHDVVRPIYNLSSLESFFSFCGYGNFSSQRSTDNYFYTGNPPHGQAKTYEINTLSGNLLRFKK